MATATQYNVNGSGSVSWVRGSLHVFDAKVNGYPVKMGMFHRHDNSHAAGTLEFRGDDLADIIDRISAWCKASDNELTIERCGEFDL